MFRADGMTFQPLTTPECERAESCVCSNFTTIQCPHDGRADSLRCRLGLAVADMGVAQRHARSPVAQQAGDDRQWNALQDNVGSKPVSQVMDAYVFNPRLLAYQISKRRGCDRAATRGRILGDGKTYALPDLGCRSGIRRAGAFKKTRIGPPLASPRLSVSPSTSRQRCARDSSALRTRQ